MYTNEQYGHINDTEIRSPDAPTRPLSPSHIGRIVERNTSHFLSPTIIERMQRVHIFKNQRTRIAHRNDNLNYISHIPIDWRKRE